MRLARVVWVVLILVVVGVAVLPLVPYGSGQAVLVDVPAGSGVKGTAVRLRAAGVIANVAEFEALRLVRGGTLKAGVYRFTKPMSMLGVYDRLRRGDVYTIALVIPEGFNLFDTAAAVQAAGLGSSGEFLQAARTHTELIRRWSPGATSLEGYLFPDTYKFSPHATTVTMLTTMVKRFGQEAGAIGLSGPEVARTVTMASLVEREVRVPGERAVVAGVFENRLRLGMPLQTDPTVAYGSLLRGTWTGVIHQSELHSESPYNTYVHKGLPPGPICSPGVASLEAAMHPAATPYLYFVAKADGSSRFATGLEEHERNVAAFRGAGK